MALLGFDRQPTRPRRMLITPENGGSPYYATVDMADEPYEGHEGVEWLKKNVLPDEVAIALGLDPADVPTPGDAFQRLAPSTPGATNWDSGNFPIESGTWAPVVPDGFTITYGTTTYMRQGSLCFISLYVMTFSGSNTSTDQFTIGGLPFFASSAPNALSFAFGNMQTLIQTSYGSTSPINIILTGNVGIRFTISTGYVINNKMPSTGNFILSGVYKIA